MALTCLYCNADISHMRKGTKFCSANHRAAYDYASKTGKQVSDPLPPVASSAPDTSLDLQRQQLAEQQLTNALLRQLLTKEVTVETEVIRQKVTYNTAPVEDNILEGIAVQRSTNTDSSTNFRLQMLFNGDPRNLQYFKVEDLQYALNMPQVFPSDLINTELAKRKPSAKKLANADMELAPPDLEDLDLL